MGATFIIGAFWGDEGKGKVSTYFSKDAAYVVRAGVGPNAEHGVFVNGIYKKTNQLPLGFMGGKFADIRIGSGTAVNPTLLFEEMERYKDYDLFDRVKVDAHCPIVEPKHMQAERDSKSMASIGSTFSGSGFCQADFTLRKAKQARDIESLKPYITDVSAEINEACRDGNLVVIESSQGTFLSLAVSDDYPNTTSKNVTTASAANDTLLNWRYIEEVVLVVKAVPSREGSGSFGASRELSIEEINTKGLVEHSSIGGVTRRKADGIDMELLIKAVEINGATQIALTFLDQYDVDMKNVIRYSKVTQKTKDLIRKIEGLTNIPVTLLETGKEYDRMLEI